MNGFGGVSHRVAGRVWNSLFDQRWVIVSVWSGGLKETQVASALPTTYLQKRPNGVGYSSSAVETHSYLI